MAGCQLAPPYRLSFSRNGQSNRGILLRCSQGEDGFALTTRCLRGGPRSHPAWLVPGTAPSSCIPRAGLSPSRRCSSTDAAVVAAGWRKRIDGMKQAGKDNAQQNDWTDDDYCEKPESAHQANHAHPRESFNTRESAFSPLCSCSNSRFCVVPEKFILAEKKTALHREGRAFCQCGYKSVIRRRIRVA